MNTKTCMISDATLSVIEKIMRVLAFFAFLFILLTLFHSLINDNVDRYIRDNLKVSVVAVSAGDKQTTFTVNLSLKEGEKPFSSQMVTLPAQ